MFGNQLKQFRTNKKITQKNLSQTLSIAPTTYNAYEKNISEPNIDTLIKFADYFQISLDELVGRDFLQNNSKLENEILYDIKQLPISGQYKALGFIKALLDFQSKVIEEDKNN